MIMTPAELLKKYGVSTNPLPFDDVVSETTQAAQANAKNLVVNSVVNPKLPKAIVLPIPKIKTNRPVIRTVKPKRTYTRRTGTEETIESVPQHLRELFKKSPPHVYKEWLSAQFMTKMDAINFSQYYKDAEIELDGFVHTVFADIETNDKQVFIAKAKSMGSIYVYILRKIVR